MGGTDVSGRASAIKFSELVRVFPLKTAASRLRTSQRPPQANLNRKLSEVGFEIIQCSCSVWRKLLSNQIYLKPFKAAIFESISKRIYCTRAKVGFQRTTGETGSVRDLL